MGLFDIFSNKNAEDAAAARIQGLNAGYGQASDLAGQGRQALTTNFTAGLQPFQTLFNQGQQGTNAYLDATGGNGAEGLSRAKGLFTQTPGYTEGLNLTLDANDRRAASRGMLGSGNTQADTAKLATDYASQKYGQYVQGLQPTLGLATSGAAGQGALYSGLGTGLNQSFGNQGQLAYNTQAGIGNAQAASDLNNYNVSQNMWGALMQGANLGSKLFGFA